MKFCPIEELEVLELCTENGLVDFPTVEDSEKLMLCVDVEAEPEFCKLEDAVEPAMLDEKLDAWILEDEPNVWRLDEKLELWTLEDVINVDTPEDKLLGLSELDREVEV